MMSGEVADAMDAASLDIFVPEDSDSQIDSLQRLDIRSDGNEPSSGFSSSTIPQRNVLHFGTLLDSMM